jgi:hypothetical protein
MDDRKSKELRDERERERRAARAAAAAATTSEPAQIETPISFLISDTASGPPPYEAEAD